MAQIQQKILENPEQMQTGGSFVVGIGASAGGWKLCSSFSAACPQTAG